MATKTLTFQTVTRTARDGTEEQLDLKPGVNVLVGRPNTGKTKWLTMLDYLTGGEGSAANFLGTVISEKYAAISATVSIAGEQHTIERNWTERGLVTRIVFDGEPISQDEFSNFILDLLDIPILRFPQGNPYASRSWPHLSWKSLYRHIYQRQRMWSDIAERQPPGDQHACVLQFLGAAERLFSPEYEELVRLNKELYGLQAAKDQFNDVASDLYRYVLGDPGMSVDITQMSVQSLVERIDESLEELAQRRETLLHEIFSADHQLNVQPASLRLGERWETLQSARKDNEDLLFEAEQRVEELGGYQRELSAEFGRLKRTGDAASLMAGLRATHCPVCDQEVDQTPAAPDTCYMCHQPIFALSDQDMHRERLIEFELAQLTVEQEELDTLMAAVVEDRDSRMRTQKEIDQELASVDSQMKPFRTATATQLPPELAQLDMEIGSLQERTRVIDRLTHLLDRREEYSARIDEVSSSISRTSASIDQLEEGLDLETKADVLSDAMNSYLNQLNAQEPASWSLDRVDVQLRERSLRFKIGKDEWTRRAGGTHTHYFILAYHYALLTLSNQVEFHYPGLSIIDFPAPIESRESIADKENFVLTPFVDMLSRDGFEDAQVIAAGSAFLDLKNVNRIELTTVWA